jgi:DNA-binding HxlR family transcriptional regulator
MVEKAVKSREKKSRGRGVDVAHAIESCIGCKWTLHVLGEIRKGVNRPGALVRTAPGLTTKVLNERLAKLVRFDILEKRVFPEIPPHVEYHFTPFGKRFIRVIDEIEKLKSEFEGQ